MDNIRQVRNGNDGLSMCTSNCHLYKKQKIQADSLGFWSGEKVVNESYDKQANVIDDLTEDVEKFKCEAQYWENAYLNLVKKVGVQQ